MYNLLSNLIKAKYYSSRNEAKSIIECLLIGKSITAEEYGMLLVVLNENYPEETNTVVEE